MDLLHTLLFKISTRSYTTSSTVKFRAKARRSYSAVTITSSINKFKSNEERPLTSLTSSILHRSRDWRRSKSKCFGSSSDTEGEYPGVYTFFSCQVREREREESLSIFTRLPSANHSWRGEVVKNKVALRVSRRWWSGYVRGGAARSPARHGRCRVREKYASRERTLALAHRCRALCTLRMHIHTPAYQLAARLVKRTIRNCPPCIPRARQRRGNLPFSA